LNASINGVAKDDFQNMNKMPMIKQILFIVLGNRKAINMGKMSRPVKSESFPVK